MPMSANTLQLVTVALLGAAANVQAGACDSTVQLSTALGMLEAMKKLSASNAALEAKVKVITGANFDRYGEEGQILVQAACTALVPTSSDGSGWAFAVKRECSGSKPDCASICAATKESQAGRYGLACFNSIHLYGNTHTGLHSTAGLKTHIYNGCGGGCGPNYCCCTEKGGGAGSAGSFDRYSEEGQILIQAACTAMVPTMTDGTGWAFAVRRECSGSKPTCAAVCAATKENQAGKNGLECFNSIHLYGNNAIGLHTKAGLKTHIYNGCGGGCGPNYCCCTEKNSKPKVKGIDDGKLSVYGTEGQTLVQAVCTAVNGGGWSFAVKRLCGSSYPSCAAVCESVREGQACRSGCKCYNSIHMYGNNPHDRHQAAGLKTYRYNSCGGGCGPNYCCCKQK